MSSQIIIGGTSIGGFIFSVKLAWYFWKERKELLELAKELGMKVKGDTKKWLKAMRKILKNWIKAIDLKASIEQKEVKGILANTFKALIKSPDVIKETSIIMSDINDLYTKLRDGVKGITADKTPEIPNKPKTLETIREGLKEVLKSDVM